MRYVTSVIMALALASCNRNSNDQVSRFHEDGRTKPSIAIASMLDSTSFDVSWSLSDEITQGVMHRIADTGQIYVHSQQESPFTENPFGTDLSWMKREFQGEEFVAFLELVEHEFQPILTKGVTQQEASNNLNMALRLRVIDLRPQHPKVVLQEMIRDTYFVPKTLIPTDYSVDVWGTESYTKSPVGIAHSQLIEEIAGRIADYILLAKSR